MPIQYSRSIPVSRTWHSSFPPDALAAVNNARIYFVVTVRSLWTQHEAWSSLTAILLLPCFHQCILALFVKRWLWPILKMSYALARDYNSWCAHPTYTWIPIVLCVLFHWLCCIMWPDITIRFRNEMLVWTLDSSFKQSRLCLGFMYVQESDIPGRPASDVASCWLVSILSLNICPLQTRA